MSTKMEKKEQSRAFSFWKISDAVLNVGTVLLLANVLILMLLQIVMRYVFNNPLTWSEEIARLSLFWMAFLGAVIAVREKSHLCVDLVVHAFPEKLSKIVTIITDLLVLAFLVGLCVWGIKYCQMNMIAKSLVTGLVKGKVYTVIPISAAWMILYHLRNMVNLLTGKDKVS